ncbi:LytR/AlgR family response regulator transcription factor [Labilibacter marinus]|uniref:LytR/AlgR family response regulator transcription factor n=1 Tax=Labilibacter marinus TaxID=1477105 RepID=UPI0008332B0D|nr:LytTR family transcriptional regulator DNA-binding domain-containing protein [Labilibacter marinus]
MSHKISVVIIDDELPARNLIKAYLKKHNNIDVLGEASNGFEGIKVVQELKPDVIFLDIQMPKVTGLEMLEVIDNPPFVIFTTAYDEYALKAFELNAIDYLLKPFSEERFDAALQKAIDGKEKVNKKVISKTVEETHQLKNERLTRIVVKKGSELNVIPVNEVVYIEADDDYVFIHTADNKFIKSATMKHFQENLDKAQFVRIHRSYILNISKINKIEQYDKESYVAIVNENCKLKVSKSGYKLLKDVLSL